MVVQEKRYLVSGLLVATTGAIAFAYHVPFKVHEYDPYHEADLVPHQKVINRVHKLGGMTFWSMPEARDFSTHSIGYGTITIRTDPYPDDLIATTGYTGFGAIYADNITFTDLGNGWDQILTQYCKGFRSAPVWGIGEAAYHEESAGKRIGDVQTVFLVRTKSQVEVEHALRSGNYYAMFKKTEAAPLRLSTFFITSEKDTAQIAGMGEELVTDAHPIVHVTVSGDSLSRPFRLDLIRSGELLYRTQAAPPYELAYRDPSPVILGKKNFYRIKISSPSTDIVSNPIFVRSP